MLILTRHREETIVIDGVITIKVLDCWPGKVRLGVLAPEEIPVHRGEIQDRIDRKRAEGGSR